jgi:hypothetical protein
MTPSLPLPIVISPPTGSSCLPIVEIQRSRVERDGTQIRFRKGSKARASADCSFGNFTREMRFSAWRFFHAAKKTELTSSFAVEDVNRRAFAFSLEHESTFVWNTPNLRLASTGRLHLEDFAESGLAGRVGEATAYLTMIDNGYVYWDRCSTIWDRAAARSSMTHKEQARVAGVLSRAMKSGKPTKEPDFLFEKQSREVALMEAKGSFVDPARDVPSTKADLQQALKQLAGWSAVITPRPSKSYAIGTYLREENDPSGDPSLVAFVDPPAPAESDTRAEGEPRDVIRRCNYGAWLIGMGLVQAGRALRELRRKRITPVDMPVARIGARDVAVSVVGWKLNPSLLAGLSIDPWRMMHWPHRFRGAALVMGIETSVLQHLREALADIQVPVAGSRTDEAQLGDVSPTGVEAQGSFMPDGTYFGMLDEDQVEDCLHRARPFDL